MAARVESEGTGFLQSELVPNLLSKTVGAEVLLSVQQLAGDAAQSAVYNALAALASRPDSRLMLEDIVIPTLVLVGEEDLLTPIGDAEIIGCDSERSLRSDSRCGALEQFGATASLQRGAARVFAGLQGRGYKTEVIDG